MNTFNVDISTDRVLVTDSLSIDGLTVLLEGHNNVFDITTNWNNISEPQFAGNLNMNFKVIDPTSYQLTFQKSDIQIADSTWVVQDSSSVFYVDQKISFKDFKIYNNSQELLIDGNLGDSTSKRLDIKARNFLLTTFNPFGQPNSEIPYTI